MLKFAISDDMAVRRLVQPMDVPGVQAHLPPGVQAARRTTGSATPTARALERRTDDDELTVRRRLALYREQTAPLEAFYRARGLLVEIDAEVP